MQRKRILALLAAVLLTASSLTACGKEQKAQAEDQTGISDSNPAAASADASAERESEKEEELLPEMQLVTDAIRERVYESRYSLHTEAEILLNGSLIQGDYILDSLVEILRDGGKGLEMTTVSASTVDEIVTRSYYREGEYHVNNGKETTVTEKSEEEVMASVSEITDLVLDAAGSVKTVDISEEEKGTAYTFSVSPYRVKSYLNTLVKKLNIEALEGAKVSPGTVTFVTVIDKNGSVTEQRMSLTGKISKAIFSVPASVELTADFSVPEEQEIDYTEFGDF